MEFDIEAIQLDYDTPDDPLGTVGLAISATYQGDNAPTAACITAEVASYFDDLSVAGDQSIEELFRNIKRYDDFDEPVTINGLYVINVSEAPHDSSPIIVIDIPSLTAKINAALCNPYNWELRQRHGYRRRYVFVGVSIIHTQPVTHRSVLVRQWSKTEHTQFVGRISNSKNN